MPKTSTLREVAARAGVSLPTASRALNNKANVLPETRAQVLRAASELGYKLQVRSASSVPARLNTVGAVVKRDPEELPGIDPFNYAILAGIEEECQRLGLNLMYASVPVDIYSHAGDLPPMLAEQAVDGLILIGPFFETTIAHINGVANMPIVLADAYAPGYDFDAVLTDNVGGARKAVKYLITQGHSRIGLIGSIDGVNQHMSIQERRQGYLQALAEHKIGHNYIEESPLKEPAAFEATRRLLARAPEVTAIFACNDEVAGGVIRALVSLGKRIPEDISVVGFDDTMLARQIVPALTTVHVHTALMGTICVRQLYDQAMREHRVQTTIRLGTDLVTRDSVCGPAGAR